MDKVNRLAKKPKVVITTTVGETPPATKLPPLPRHGTEKGLMTAKVPSLSSALPSFTRTRDMPSIGQLSSIIKDDDYEDLGNHATETMGETGLFNLA